VHEYTYLRYLDEKCKASVGFGGGATSSSSSGADRGKSVMALPAFYAPPGMLDSDTPLQPQSLEAAKRFCG
jgi:acetoin utilization deacetylase AcuC-like enzyme